MKLAVCYPWESPFVYSAFAQSIMNLRHPCETQFFRGKGWSSSRRHTHMCEQAVDWGTDLICMLSADQVYEPDLLKRLYDRFHEGYEVVGALIPVRGHIAWQDMKPFQPMAWRWKREGKVEVDDTKIRQYRGIAEDGDMMEMVTANQGMQRINFIGSGVLMFHRDHLLSLKKPWFYERIRHDDQTRLPVMDTTFSWRLQTEAYAKMWCDTDIKVRHLHVFEIDETFQDRFEDWTASGGAPEICMYEQLHPQEAFTAI